MENGKTDAMAPKKNAAPAEPSKSLGATIQNVIGKAVTSPTDGKIDFAQGVNHITGDAHQKSAKPAEPMQSLKAGYDMKPKSETYEDKEEVKEADEKEKEKMMKAQADIKKMNANVDKEKEMKEGEIPAGLQKYLDKKKGDDKSEEKHDDKKKEVKEASHDDEKKELKAQKDDEKKDEVKEASHDDEKKELKAQKDDEKEVKEEKEDEKKEIKASAKEKVKDMDMKEDVAALTDGEELSEEFKAKAATIFESAVKAKLVEEIEKLEGEYETKVAEKVEESKEEIVEKVDAYLNYVVEQWMKDNELAIERGLKS